MYCTHDFRDFRVHWVVAENLYLRHGMFPLWMPTEGLGESWVGNRGQGWLYPLKWLSYIPTAFLGTWPFEVQYVVVLLHIWIGMVGVYMFCHRVGRVGHVAALFSAVAFLCNQPLNEAYRYPYAVENLAWCPWIVYFSATILTQQFVPAKRVIDRCVMLTLVTMLSWMAGYGQYTYLTIILLPLLCLPFINRYTNVLAVAAGVRHHSECWYVVAYRRVRSDRPLQERTESRVGTELPSGTVLHHMFFEPLRYQRTQQCIYPTCASCQRRHRYCLQLSPCRQAPWSRRGTVHDGNP